MLTSSHYGKSRVRLVKVERQDDHHDFSELNIDIQFTGEYDDCYLQGDNSRILPTDTMKNTVYALAAGGPVGAIEEFGKRLCAHFLQNNQYLRSVRIDIEKAQWSRLGPHSFQKGSELRTARIGADGSVQSGLKDLILLKTADSSFEGYIHDRYTTLKEASDRILGTAVQATWLCSKSAPDYDVLWQGVRLCMIDVFKAHVSPSVQSTLYAMGEAVLATFPDVTEIYLSLPNKHCIPVNLEPFGLVNANEVFVPVDEPHGLIEATLRR